MKIVPFILAAVLISSCSDVENNIEDLRDGDEVVEQNSSSEDVSNDTGTNDKSVNVNVPNEGPPIISNAPWSYEVVSISENNWGYQLFQEGKMIINQTTIPSVQGINAFDSKEKAERTAKHILFKLENGIFPPTVSKEELDSLDVLRD